MNLNARLAIICNWYMQDHNITQKAFAEILGVSTSQLSSILKGRDKAGLSIVEKFLNSDNRIDANWLISGQGEMLKNRGENRGENRGIIPKTEEKTSDKNIYGINDNVMQMTEPQMTVRRLKTDYFNLDKQLIPLYEIDAAAGLNILFSNQNTQIPLDYISVPNAPRCDGALYIRGDSMYPVLKSGDIACYKIIKEFDDIRYGEIHILDIEDSSDRYLTAKYIQKSDNGSEYLKLVSENKYHSDRDIHKSTIKAIGLVKIWIRYNTIS